MKTRARRAQQEQQGIPPTPPQTLPPATRAPRNKTARPALAAAANTEQHSEPDVGPSNAAHASTFTNQTQTGRVVKPRSKKQKRKEPSKEVAAVLQDAIINKSVHSGSSPVSLASVAPLSLDPMVGVVLQKDPESTNLAPSDDDQVVGEDSDNGSLSSLSSPPPSPKSPDWYDSSDGDGAERQDSDSSPLSPPSLNSPEWPGSPRDGSLDDSSSSSSDRDGPEAFTKDDVDQSCREVVFNWPGIDEACRNFTMINFLINEEIARLNGDNKLQDVVNVAIPTAMLPDLVRYICRHPLATRTELEHLLDDNEFTQALQRKLTGGFICTDNSSNVSLIPSPQTEPVPPRVANPRSSMLDMNCAQTDAPTRAEDTVLPDHKRTTLVRQDYDEHGNLTLGAYKEVEVQDRSQAGMEAQAGVQRVDMTESPTADVRSEGTVATGATEPLTSVQTPQASLWAISRYLPSTASVTNFFGLGTPSPVRHNTQTQPQTTSQAITTQTRHEPTNQAATEAELHHLFTPLELEALSTRLHPRHRPRPKHPLVIKSEQQTIERQREEIRRLRAELASQKGGSAETINIHVDRQKGSGALRRATLESSEASTAQTEEISKMKAQESKEKKAQGAGSKRKRSLDVIPNPPGGGYGMDLQYFGADSDDDDEKDDAEVGQTHTQKSTKKSRISEVLVGDNHEDTTPTHKPVKKDWDYEKLGDPHRAKPYTGKMFAFLNDPPAPARVYGNTFLAQEEMESRESASVKSSTTPVGPTITFRVPSPGDSDSDEGDISVSETSPVPLKPASPSSEITPSRVNVFSEAAAQPEIGTSALDRARQSALKHQPTQPSRLREASRLSTSTVASSPTEERASEMPLEFSSYSHYEHLMPDHVRDIFREAWVQHEGGDHVARTKDAFEMFLAAKAEHAKQVAQHKLASTSETISNRTLPATPAENSNASSQFSTNEPAVQSDGQEMSKKVKPPFLLGYSGTGIDPKILKAVDEAFEQHADKDEAVKIFQEGVESFRTARRNLVV